MISDNDTNLTYHTLTSYSWGMDLCKSCHLNADVDDDSCSIVIFIGYQKCAMFRQGRWWRQWYIWTSIDIDVDSGIVLVMVEVMVHVNKYNHTIMEWDWFFLWYRWHMCAGFTIVTNRVPFLPSFLYQFFVFVECLIINHHCY